LSGLLKKRIQVDRSLGLVIGFPEGATVSYAEIQKGLHKYIRDKNLRTDIAKGATAAVPQASQPEAPKGQARGFYCISCGEPIPSGSTFCDLCGTLQ
jgi:hypothetical protein